MKKLLLFAFVALLGFNANAQEFQPGWEPYWTGFDAESRGVSDINILPDANNPVTWIIAYDGSEAHADLSAIAKSTDDGETWTTYDPVQLPGAVNLGISMVFPTDANTAYLCGFKRQFGNGGIWKTTTGGEGQDAWVKVSTGAMYTNADSFCNVVYFFDADHGFSQGDPINGDFEIYTTSDAGATWTPVAGDKIDDPIQGEYGYTHGYAAAGSTVWFTTNKGRIFRSKDQGATWKAFQTPLTDFGSENDNGDIAFKDDNEGWILRGSGEFYHTTDGGETWTEVQTTGLDGIAPHLAYVKPGTTNTQEMLIAGSAASGHAGTAYSTDGGATWKKHDVYKLGANWIIPQDSEGNIIRFQHTTISARDADYVLSGSFSHKHDANNPDDNLPDMGIFKLAVSDITVQGIADQKIEGLKVYPNPATDVVNISTKKAGISNISVVDMMGKEVINFNANQMNNVTVTTSNLENGIYILKVTDANNAQQTLKLVIK